MLEKDIKYQVVMNCLMRALCAFCIYALVFYHWKVLVHDWILNSIYYVWRAK